MAFEKMTAQDLFDEFIRIFPKALGSSEQGLIVSSYWKVGARMLRLEMNAGPALYFLWYDENNWNLGTKPYRNRPVKQQYARMRKKLEAENTFNDLKKGVEMLPPETNLTMDEAILQMKIAEAKGLNEGFRELKTKSNGAITTCNQWENIERETEAMANEPLEPIDWVKEDPEVVMASYPPSAE